MKQPTHPEPVQKSSFQMRKRMSLVEVFDRVFFIFAGIATLWLGVLLFMEGWSVHLSYWIYFIVFWVVVAYLGLPRLHRILSYIYAPDYFIGRTRTGDGILGDPVNIAVRGSEAQLHAAMEAAGWTQADDITVKSTWKMIVATVRRRSYLHAPVSSLYLFGRQQDFAYQQEVDGSPGKRHHVRFWRCPRGWLLPGGHQVDWLAAGTYDRSVGLSLFTLQITHKIDENTDIERDFIVKSVTMHTQDAEVEIIKDFSTGYHARNGGGDMILTDGDLPILNLTTLPVQASLETTPERVGVALDGTRVEQDTSLTPTAELGEALWNNRPLQLVAGVLLVGVIVVMELVQFVQAVLGEYAAAGNVGQHAAQEWQIIFATISIVSLAIVLVEAVFVFFVLRGSAFARLALMAAASVVIIETAIGFFIYHQPVRFGDSLVSVSLHIGVLLALSSDAARRFVYRPRVKRGAL